MIKKSGSRVSFSARSRKEISVEKSHSLNKEQNINASNQNILNQKQNVLRMQSAKLPKSINGQIQNQKLAPLNRNISDNPNINNQQQQKRSKVPQYLKEMNILEKKQNEKIIQNMNKRINFMRNPRYEIIRPPIQFTDIQTKQDLLIDVDSSKSLFRAIPSYLLFQNYLINDVYEINLKIVNVSKVSQRIKFLPPQSDQFAISKVTYPGEIASQYELLRSEGFRENVSREKGMIAPGMSLNLNVKFFATSFSEFRDEITFISEENVFKVPLIAQKEAPQVNLPEILDCQSCWLGDRADMVFRLQNRGGEAGFKFFCEDQRDDIKQNGETLQTECFTLYPCEFYIQKNEVIEIFVTFAPKKEGITREKIILACDNLTSAVYTLQGTGNMAELGIHGVDHVILSEIPEVNKMDPQTVLKKIFFNDASPGTVISRYIIIQNKAQVRVKYHWSLSKTDMRSTNLEIGQPDDYYFSIDPPSGYFEKGETKKFKVSFSSRDPIPIYEYANLIIDDISLESIRNPPESIRRMKDIPQVLVYDDKGSTDGKGIQGDTHIKLEQIDNLIGKDEELNHGKQIVKPGFIGSNTDRPSLTYFEFELIGLSTYSKVQIDPPFQNIPGQLLIGKLYYKDFQIINLSDSEVFFNISISDKCQNLNSIIGDIKNKTGAIAPRQRKAVTVGFTSNEIGPHKSITFKIDFDKAHSLVMELVGDFVGPSISLNVPMVNFDLFKAGDVGKYKFEIKNESDIEAEFLFKENDQKGSFDDHKNGILKRVEKEKADPNGGSFLYIRDENERFYKKAQERVLFEPSFGKIPPNSKIQIEVKCGCEDAITIYRIIECMVRNGHSVFLELKAEIQKIHVSLNRYILKSDTLYACNEYTYMRKKSPQYIEIQNLGNLPCDFDWETEANEKVEKREHIKYNFTPSKGTIPPKSKLPIKFEFSPLEGGQINELFVLNCQGLEFPLGFEFQAQVLGLSVEYDLIESTNENANPNHSIMEATSRALASKHNIKILGSSIEHKQQTLAKQHKLEAVEFYDCKINKPKTIKICIRNTSGVNTTFEIFPKKYQPYMNDEVKSPAASIMFPNSMADDLNLISGLNSISNVGKLSPLNQEQELQMKAIRFSQSINSVPSQMLKKDSQVRIHKKSLKPLPPKPVVLLTDDIEKKNNFTSTSGQALNQTKKLDKDQRIYLANDKGIAILCEPMKGRLKAHSEVIIKISCFNDICGKFKDECIIDVKGLPLQKFPLVAEVKGSPVVVMPNQLGMGYKGDWPCFNFGTYMRNINTMKREFKISNTGPKDITLDWKIYNLDDQKNVSEFFKIKIEDPHLGSDDMCQLKFEPVEPNQAENSPFTILENTISIEGRQEKSIKLEYNSQIDTTYNYVMVGKPRLINPRDSISVLSQIEDGNTENHPAFNMGTVAVYLKATSITPELHFDKLKNVEGSHKLKFEKWALSDNKKESKDICLVNLLQSNLLFTVNVVGPFKIIQSVTNSQAKYDQSKSLKLLNKDKLEVETKFNLVQNSNLKLSLDFQGPSVTDQDEWPLTYKVYKYGVLHLNYINGDSQVIELEGQLLRPQLKLNTSGTEDVEGTDVQDFGTTHINNFKTIVIYLSNLSKVPANWKLNHMKSVVRRGNSAISLNTTTKLETEDSIRTDDPSVFEFQISEGTLLGPSIPIKSFPDTLALPGKKTSALLQQQQLYPQKIYINFRPKVNILYKSKFRITVQEGPYLDFTLRGTGSYEENKFK